MSYNTPVAWNNTLVTIVPDLFRHTTTDDLLYSLPEEGGDGFTVRSHESYDAETLIEENRIAPHFATESEAERYAWGWMIEGDIDEPDYYSMEAQALVEGLEDGEWGLHDSQETPDVYNEQLGRSMIRLMNAEGEVRWFDTCNDAHTFLCGEDGVDDRILDSLEVTEIALDEGTYIRYNAK